MMRFLAYGSENPVSYGPVTTCASGRKVIGPRAAEQSGWGSPGCLPLFQQY